MKNCIPGEFGNILSTPSTPLRSSLPPSLPPPMYRPTACLFSCRVERTAILSTLRGALRHVVVRDAKYRRCWLGHNFSTSPLPFTSFPLYYQGSLFLSYLSPPLRQFSLYFVQGSHSQQWGFHTADSCMYREELGAYFYRISAQRERKAVRESLKDKACKCESIPTPNRWRSVMRHCLISLTK